MKKKSNRGFTLIELMIVVAIIAVVASIAIPGILTARRAANENAAFGNIKSFVTAAATFASNREDQRYFSGTTEFEGFISHLDTKGGYEFTYEANVGLSKFTYIALPVSANTGSASFYGDERNQIFEAQISEAQATIFKAGLNASSPGVASVADFSVDDNTRYPGDWRQKN